MRLRRAALMAAQTRRLLLDKRLETREGLIPLVGNAVKILLHSVKRARIENEAAFAAATNAVDESSALEHAQVLGDGLAG